MRHKYKKIFSSSILPWLCAALFLSLAVTEYGGTNPLSRFATMRAFTESHTFAIDYYQDWSIDWSRSPNGHIYSNKAPGGALLGLPVFIVTDFIAWMTVSSRDEFGRRPAPAYWQVTLQWLLLQGIPYLMICYLLANWLCAIGTPRASVQTFAIAALFGNTGAIFINSYFGHALAAWLFLATLYFWIKRRYGWSTMALGFACLSDYLVLPALPIFFFLTLWREQGNWNWLKQSAVGIFPALTAWVAYHSLAFGAPWAIASQFINPDQIEKVPSAAMGGIWQIIPPLENFSALLFGQSRGLLFTQPWILLTAIFFPLILLRPTTAPARGKKLFLWLYLILALCTISTLWLNAGFTTWHGGYSAGPRYLAFILPAWALLFSLLFSASPRWLKFLLGASLALALVLRGFIFAKGILAPNSPLWSYYWSQMNSGTAWLRFGIFSLTLLGAAFWAKRRQRDSVAL